jgi:oligo-1,6-glucosidase
MENWWKERLIYQIYPRSFQDSNGDGIGDIPGIISRLDELTDLGVGIIWLSPVYRSPDADNGYDIADYQAIDPKYGTMADMDKLLAEAKKRDIKIVMDLVINHTSDEHEWFQKSRDKNSEYRDYYIWQPPKGEPGAPPSKKNRPNNWTSFFMGDAWEFDPQSGEYYLHLFHKKQPDLNYKNPRVIEEIKGILRFWLDKGVAGFRCDVINIIYKTSLEDGKGKGVLPGMEHYVNQEGTHRILQELRREVLDQYDCFTVGETVMVDLPAAKLLCDESRRELNMLFYFEHLQVDRLIERYIPKKFKAGKLLEVLTKWQQGLEWNAVYLENHDQSRIVSHYGDDGEYWKASAKLLATLEFTLRGTPFVYQGQEIGMTNFDFTGFDEVNDVETLNLSRLMKRIGLPEWLRWKWLKESSRDNARTPVQWNAAANAGFTTGKPWLKINHNYKQINYESQKNDPDSVLSFYKKLISLRASSETLKYGGFKPLYTRDGIIAYERAGVRGSESYIVILNISKKQGKAVFPGEIIISNTGRTEQTGTLLPYEALVLRNK